MIDLMQKIDTRENNIEEFKNLWKEKYQGELLTVSKKNIGGFEVRFNPLRARYMTSTQHAAIDSDVFCHKWNDIVKNEKIGEVVLPHYSWILTTNTSPIEEYHSLLICSEHQNQEMTLECIEDLYSFSLKYPEISIGFNGWGGGASQKHLHAQLFFSSLPITHWKKVDDYGQVDHYPGICFTFTSPGAALAMIKELAIAQIPCNALFTEGTIFLAPRKSEDDGKNVKRGFDSVFGKVPLLTQDVYEQAIVADVEQILVTLLYQSLQLGGKYFTS